MNKFLETLESKSLRKSQSTVNFSKICNHPYKNFRRKTMKW